MRAASLLALSIAMGTVGFGCSLETNAIAGRPARDGGGGSDAGAIDGATDIDGGVRDAAQTDGGAMTTDAGPSDGGEPDAEAPFVNVFTLNPGLTTCPLGWVYAAFAEACREVRVGCGDAQSSIFVDPGREWQEIRGFVRGLQGQTPDAFVTGATSLDDVYVDGVSITTGMPRRHLWTFAAGLFKPTSPGNGNSCPCDNGEPAPALVGDAWTCETGNDTDDFLNAGPIYLSDTLWDADGDAHGAGCARVMDPGWFEARLPTPTTDRIEIRIMSDTCDDNVVVTALELEVR